MAAAQLEILDDFLFANQTSTTLTIDTAGRQPASPQFFHHITRNSFAQTDAGDLAPGAMLMSAAVPESIEGATYQFRGIATVVGRPHRNQHILVDHRPAEHSLDFTTTDQQVGHFADDLRPLRARQQAERNIVVQERILQG